MAMGWPVSSDKWKAPLESPLTSRVTQVSRFKPWESQNNNSFFLEKVKE